MSNPISEELSWQAFLYACGEMPPEDAEAFEESLAVDQAAREALAHAVLVGQAVTTAAAATDPIAVPVTGGTQRLSLARSVALVAGLLLAFGVGWVVSQSWNVTQPGDSFDVAEGSSVTDFDANRLISLWGNVDLLAESESDLAWSDDDESESILTAGLVDDDSTTEFSVPAWMLAAVENNLPPEMEDDMRDPSRIP